MNQYDDLYETQIEGKPKRKRHQDPTTWGDAWRAIGIFISAMLGIGILSIALQRFIYGDLYSRYTDITLSASGLNTTGGFGDMFEFVGSSVYLLIVTLVGAVISVIGIFIISGILHVFSSKVFGGEGTLRGLITRVMPWTTGVAAVYGLISAVWGYYLMNVVVNRYEGVNITQSVESLNAYSQFIISQSVILYLVMFIAWIAWGVKTGFVTAENYQITKNKGCISLILTNVTLAAMYCGCLFAFGAVIAAAITYV